MRQLSQQDSATLRSSSDVLTRVQVANAQHGAWSRLVIQQLDDEWQRVVAAQQPLPAWMSEVLHNSLSQRLNSWLDSQDDRYTEAFITDAQGLLVASAQITSDYWQGDEEKFTQTFALAAKPQNSQQSISWIDTTGGSVGVIRFDDSSHRFLTHISFPLWQPGITRPVGVLTLGLNIEEVLRQK